MSLPYTRSPHALVAVLLLSLAVPAQAQYGVPARPYYVPVQTQGLVRPVGVPQRVPVGVPTPVPVPVPGYPATYVQDRVNGALTGVADLTTATAQSYQTIEQAKLTQEEVTRSRIDTRRKLNDEMAYEYANRPTQGKMIAEEQAARIQRSRNNPPLTIIWSGDALNDLLAAIQTNETNFGVRGASVYLDEDGLPRINLTAGTTPGSIGLYRSDRRLRWPLPLQDDRFQTSRDKITMLSAIAARSVAEDNPNDKAIRDLLAAIAALKDEVTAATQDQSPSDNIRSMRYVKELREGAQTMTDPNAANFLNGKWAANGDTVGQLVDFMSRKGLRFAPATDGDEPYYTALYRSVLSYDSSILRLINSR